MNLNYVWLVGIGIVMLIIAVVTAIDTATPILIQISMMLTNPPIKLEKNTKDDMSTFGIIVQLFCAMKAGVFILWYFFSNNLSKTRKVKEMVK